MKTPLLVLFLLSSFALVAHSEQQSTNAPVGTNASAAAPKYQPTNPSRKNADGFATTLSYPGKLQWTADGWLDCYIATLLVTGTAPGIERVQLVLAENVQCVKGEIPTEKFGVVKIRLRENYNGKQVPGILMTPEMITKIRQALETKAKAAPEKK